MKISTVSNYIITIICSSLLIISGAVGYFFGIFRSQINNKAANETMRHCADLIGASPTRNTVADKWFCDPDIYRTHTRTKLCVACGSSAIHSCTGHIHKGGGTAIASWCIKHEEGRGWSNHNIGTCKGCYGNREDLEIITD